MKTQRKHAIVVVDDDEVIVELLKEVFKDYGFFVFGVKSGECLYRILHSIRPEIILMDYWIKGDETGAQVVKSLQSEKELREIPVLFMTGAEFREDIDKLGVKKLMKPYELEDLIKMVLEITAH